MLKITHLLLIILLVPRLVMSAMLYHSFILFEIHPSRDSVPLLSEIIIEGKKKKMQIKNDTTIFNVGAFRDGTEKKIEELIAKLPGMSVNPDNGIISYQGRTVEAVKIDGADLLGSNYMTGTRNISIDLIEEIEAVTNDPANPLLKSMHSKGKMILNLKTKNKFAASNGEISLGAGKRGDLISTADIQANLLRLSRRVKIFNVVSYNNRGVNNGSFNYFRPAQPTHVSDQQRSFSESFFDPLLPVLPLDHHRYNINNMQMLNGNFMFQPGNEYHDIRLNFFLMQDRHYAGYSHRNNYDAIVNATATSDQFSLISNPIHGEAEIEWKKLLTRKIWLQFRSRLDLNHHRSDFTQILNDSLLIQGRFNTARIAHTHSMDFTYRINEKIVQRSLLNLAHERNPENFSYKTGDDHRLRSIQQTQHTNTSTSLIDYKNIITLKKRTRLYDFETGVQYCHLSFFSFREDGEENRGIFHIANGNRQEQDHRIIYQSVGITQQNKKISWTGKAVMRLHHFSWINKKGTFDEAGYLLLEPSLTITQKLGSLIKWVHQMGANNEPVTNKTFLHQPLIISPRMQMLHDVTPQLQRHIHYNSRLLYQNLFRQQNAQLGFQYSVIDKSPVADMQIDERYITTRITVASVPQTRWQVNGQFEFFIRKLSANFIIDATAGRYNYYNQVNAKLLRENKVENWTVGLQCNTSFRFPVNIFYKYSLNRTFIRTDMMYFPGNDLVNHHLRLLWRRGKTMFAQFSAEGVQAARNGAQMLFFLDLLMSYKPQKKKYAFSLAGKNLLDQRHLTQVQRSDYGRVFTQTRLLSAYLMLQFEYRF